ncbi:MAG: PilZ domain-containing protein [Deltaproteobacteria bacterium]|nr:PilZ domain-containing protein [Deltaproteobacteria bacterium]
MDKEQIIVRINELLQEMSKDNLVLLLNHLEKIPSKWKRKHARKTCSISVDFDTSDYSSQKPIRNVSVSGAYVEAEESFSVGQQIVLWLSVPNEKNSSFKIPATVARRDANGIGVKFENLSGYQKEMLERFKDSDQF